FLDEPTTGLDPRTRARMWATIRDLIASGSTVLLTTQMLDEADHLADRIAVIDNGTVVAEGTPGSLKESVGTSSLQLRLEDAGELATAAVEVERVLGSSASLSPGAGELTVPLQNSELVADVLIALRSSNIRVVQLAVQKPSLDEVFL